MSILTALALVALLLVGLGLFGYALIGGLFLRYEMMVRRRDETPVDPEE